VLSDKTLSWRFSKYAADSDKVTFSDTRGQVQVVFFRTLESEDVQERIYAIDVAKCKHGFFSMLTFINYILRNNSDQFFNLPILIMTHK
jgi:hypothetical protein